MLEVRKLRAGDVKLQPIYYDIPETDDDEPDGVLLKAETRRGVGVRADHVRNTLDWASLHMNLSLQNAVAPGAELLLAVADEPPPAEGNTFIGQLGTLPVNGLVNIPEDDDGSEFSFTLTPANQMGTDKFQVTFQGYQAHKFIRALLYWWLPGLQK